MIKRNTQEIADFFGGYVAQNRNGKWHLFYSSEPYIDDIYGTWEDDTLGGIYIDSKLIDVPEGHDWQTIYKPQPIDAIKVFKDIQERKNSTPHQSEVHTHREYVLLGEFDPSVLGLKVNEYLGKGFKLYGNPWTGPDTGSAGYLHYQAMVRGI